MGSPPPDVNLNLNTTGLCCLRTGSDAMAMPQDAKSTQTDLPVGAGDMQYDVVALQLRSMPHGLAPTS